MIETDGVDLRRVFNVDQVDFKQVMSNDIIEIKDVLGIEAAKTAINNEFLNVLSFYGIYVNRRHLSILTEIMTSKGKLTSITRHGINRLESGPLRKCSFEETVEILLEAGVLGEVDHLNGVTENIMLGNMAPMGTGFMDVKIDPVCVIENAVSLANHDVELADNCTK